MSPPARQPGVQWPTPSDGDMLVLAVPNDVTVPEGWTPMLIVDVDPEGNNISRTVWTRPVNTLNNINTEQVDE